MKNYRPWEPDRVYLLPQSTRDWLPEDHLAWFILDVVEQLDLRAIDEVLQAKDPRGMPPYAPKMMTALLVYGYCVGVYSSRKIARATWTDVAFRVLAGDQHPHFTTVNQFRLDHLDALSGLFLQVLKLCQKAGMVELGHVAIDGTRVQANASKHKAMSYDRMTATEAKLKEQVDELLQKAQETDQAEDRQYGPGVEPQDLPDELRRRQTRLAQIAKAKAALEAEAAAARKLELEEQAARWRESAADATSPSEAATLERRAEKREQSAQALAADTAVIPGVTDGLPFHTVPHEVDGVPKPKAQRNFTDPDSRIMAHNGTYVQAYNVQAMADESHQVVVAIGVTNAPPDVRHLVPMTEQVRSNTGGYPRVLTGDAGFWCDDNGDYCEQNGIDAFISTRRRPHDLGPDDPNPSPASFAARTAKGEAMEKKVTNVRGREIYRRRKWTIEPVFGQAKEVRGFRRFSLRGLKKVRGEAALVFTAHNLLKLKVKLQK